MLGTSREEGGLEAKLDDLPAALPPSSSLHRLPLSHTSNGVTEILLEIVANHCAVVLHPVAASVGPKTLNLGELGWMQSFPLLYNTVASPEDGGDSGQKNSPSFESADDFERRLFGDKGDDKMNAPFYRKLDKLEKAHERYTVSRSNVGNGSSIIDGISNSFDSLSDGMDEKLDKAARTFTYSNEIQEEDYRFRPDVTFYPGNTYSPRDLDLTKPGIHKPPKRTEFTTTTKEVLRKADFRNVRFLANFLTEAGIIIKRSHTRISAKAQRKVAREIKTARAFGLLPFTSMGRKPFAFGRNMKDDDDEYETDDNIAAPSVANNY
ncbi:hypothetical protein ZIOFF_041537 [Zingiber officinale]|uniref:Small ribosomal subunit protein bS18c n=2 Tax=Zingiber officinale TaxID=94328 RepID=A0A8J5KYV6_ZINOF|nr:hypothetical protein ZIOFF_041537 [Zingiber officinale]